MANGQTLSPHPQRHLSGVWKELEVATPGQSGLTLQLPPMGEGAAGPAPGRPVRPQLNRLLFKSLPCDESWASGGEGSCPPAWTPRCGGPSGCPPSRQAAGGHSPGAARVPTGGGTRFISRSSK